LIISTYSLVEIVFASNEVPKFSGGAVDPGKRVVNPMKLFFLPVLVDGVEADKLVKDSGTELRGGGENLLFFQNICGRFSANSSTSPSSEQGSHDTDKRISEIREHSFIRQFIFGMVGCGIGILIFWFIYPFTQRGEPSRLSAGRRRTVADGVRPARLQRRFERPLSAA
jgi:hypothetical protein